MTQNKPNVATPRNEVVSANEYARLPEDLIGGTISMRKAGERYIPKGPEESKDVWDARVNAAVLLNIYKRTVGTLVGQVFSRDVALTADEDGSLPEPFAAMSEDVDLQGNSLSVWAAQFFEDCIHRGGGVILVDFPHVSTRKGEGGSLEYKDRDGVWRKKTAQADAENGWRPYFVHIRQSDILGWRFEAINGKRVLVQLRFTERVTDHSGRWDVEDTPVEQVRVLEPGRWEVWRKSKQEGGREEWTLYDQGATSINVIPAAWMLLGERCGEMCAAPALEDLAHLNRRHWQSTVDQYDLMSWMRRPVWLGVGLAQQTAEGEVMPSWGPGTLLNSSSSEARLESASINPDAVVRGQEELDKIEQQMSIFGLRVLMPQTNTAATTATQNNLEASETDSTLKRWAQSLKDCLEQAFVFAGVWVGVEDENVPSVAVNTEFHLLAGMTMQEIKTAVDTGLVSKRLAFEELKRRGLVPDDSDWEETSAEIENESRQAQGPSLGAGLAAGLLGNQGQGSAA